MKCLRFDPVSRPARATGVRARYSHLRGRARLSRQGAASRDPSSQLSFRSGARSHQSAGPAWNPASPAQASLPLRLAPTVLRALGRGPAADVGAVLEACAATLGQREIAAQPLLRRGVAECQGAGDSQYAEKCLHRGLLRRERMRPLQLCDSRGRGSELYGRRLLQQSAQTHCGPGPNPERRLAAGSNWCQMAFGVGRR